MILPHISLDIDIVFYINPNFFSPSKFHPLTHKKKGANTR